MSKAIKLIKGAAEINKAIESVGRRGAKLDGDIQLAALSILAHVEEHGDTTLADRLFSAMPKGARRVMLADWFVAFGKMRTLDKSDAEDKARIENGAHFAFDKVRSTDMEGASEKQWHEMRKAQEASEAFDAQKAVQGVLSRLNAAAKAGKDVQGKAEAIEAARALLAALEAE